MYNFLCSLLYTSFFFFLLYMVFIHVIVHRSTHTIVGFCKQNYWTEKLQHYADVLNFKVSPYNNIVTFLYVGLLGVLDTYHKFVICSRK